MSHPSKGDVDRFMDHIKVVINLRLESDRIIMADPLYPLIRRPSSIKVSELRQESDKMLKKAEYMLYELIDNALDDGVFHAESQGALE